MCNFSLLVLLLIHTHVRFLSISWHLFRFQGPRLIEMLGGADGQVCIFPDHIMVSWNMSRPDCVMYRSTGRLSILQLCDVLGRNSSSTQSWKSSDGELQGNVGTRIVVEMSPLGPLNWDFHNVFCIMCALCHWPCELLPQALILHHFYSRQTMLILGALLQSICKLFSVSANP